MATKSMNKKSWESMSSTFSTLEISLSQDSCYASDEVSVTSTNPTSMTTSVASSLIPAIQAPLRPLLKPILKRSYAEIEEDEESESGYASDDVSEYEHDAFIDEIDDDICYVTAWDDESDAMSDSCEDDDDSFDGSFISFESNSVRFDSKVIYIEAPEAPEAQEDEISDSGMTCHEIMELARASGNFQPQKDKYAGVDLNDGDNDNGDICDSIKQLPEEHTSDVVDLDKRLFIAYINGIKGIADPEYKARLRARTNDMKTGRAHSPYMESDSANGVYIDHALNHVIGIFRNIVAKEEFDELIGLSDQKEAAKQRPEITEVLGQGLLEKIEGLLSERLANGDVGIGPDELSFFAGGVAYAIDHWRPYICH
ncbi:hypothetical protein EYZ11_005877 [Aspergillus tanneri]|uniref:Uncharacterized protein n=1 Tax=Aspergillus tanneri TaxID=1220188 RepID=A0A4S3JHG2_9EURO|nr:uncharacterized protein ATNIH1004_002543 [Aspergillus tanneri]KAA8649864.1 hypothetical protein ATNIH1004_002543 [Aspergillus tanneri]THC94655.1 hypothetical protein EYZ11_005877 [Aspergillus tanneri]